jgi:hypothetical protein
MPWKVVTIIWPVLVAALLPLDLPRALARLPAILARLDALDADGDYRHERDRSKPHQVDDFRSRFAPRIRGGG